MKHLHHEKERESKNAATGAGVWLKTILPIEDAQQRAPSLTRPETPGTMLLYGHEAPQDSRPPRHRRRDPSIDTNLSALHQFLTFTSRPRVNCYFASIF